MIYLCLAGLQRHTAFLALASGTGNRGLLDLLSEFKAAHAGTTCDQRWPLRILEMQPFDTPYFCISAFRSGGAFLIASMSSAVSCVLPLRSPRFVVPWATLSAEFWTGIFQER